jgi:asparagine synthase (glutamine-hydrolysing)
MSGIAGIYHLDGRPVDPTLLTRMTDIIADRGPDGEGHWLDGSVGLGHRMLNTTSASLHQKQPVVDDTGQLAITADARIDNRDELIGTLGVNGQARGQITDAELILRAYGKWGEACPEKLLGDFAFAIWDRREHHLFCARDPIGIKPFYYYHDGDRFLCASEPQQIFQDPSIARQPNLCLIGRYLLNDFSEREETLYAGVTRLPPAHSLICNAEQIHKRQYWDVDPAKEIRYSTDEEYAEHFLALFRDAVKSRLRSSGPVGAWLSGGLDSSSIVCMAQKLSQEGALENKGFETFSIVFDELPCDERPYIDAVVQKWGLTSHTFLYEQNLAAVDIQKLSCYPGVLYDPVLFMLGPAQESAARNGIKVILSGVGGDDLLATGFYHLADLLRRLRIRDLVAQIKGDTITYGSRPLDLLLHHALRPLIPHPVKMALRGLLKAFRRNGIPPWMNADFVEQFRLKDYLRKVAPLQRFPTLSQGQIYHHLGFGWNNNVGLPLIDQFAAHFSLECRYPFFDRRLVEYLLGIPEEQRWWRDRPKTVLRNAMRDILPEAVRERKTKADFCPVYDRELKGRQREEVSKIIRTLALADLGVVYDKAIWHMFRAYCQGKSEHANPLVVILMLELWYRTEFNQNPLNELQGAMLWQ